MDFALRLLIVLLPVGYFAYARRTAADFRGERRDRPDLRSGRLLSGGVLLAHAVLIAWLSIRNEALAIGSAAQALSALAAGLFGVFLFASRDGAARSLGWFVGSACFLIQIAAAALGLERDVPAAATRGTLFDVHVATAVMAAAVMLLSGFAGVVYLVLERQMRRRTFGLLYDRLPNLGDLATLNRRAAAAGFLCMTVGVNWGIWLAHDRNVEGFSYRDPQVLATLALWIHFGLIALPKRVAFVTGARAARGAALGLALLIATFAVSLVPGLSKFHRFS